MKKIHLVPVIIFLIVLFYLVVIRARPLAPGTAANSFAIGATFVIGLCFFLGPLSRMSSKYVVWLRHRKPLGLWGFLFAAIHVGAVMLLDFGTITAPENLYSMISGIIAFVIFALMTATSTGKAIAKMGYPKWKKLQRTGYIAFFFVLIHFTVLENGFVQRQLGQVLFGFVLLILLIRILMILAGRKEAYKEHEFHELHGIEKHEENE